MIGKNGLNKPVWSEATAGKPDSILTPGSLSADIASLMIEKRVGFEFIPDSLFDVFNFDGSNVAAVQRGKEVFHAWLKSQEKPTVLSGGDSREPFATGQPQRPSIR
jgi:hypothetical protein